MAGIQKEIWVHQADLPRLTFTRTALWLSTCAIWRVLLNTTELTLHIQVFRRGWAKPDLSTPEQQRTDTPDFVELDNYATEAIMVRDIETIELAYNKRESYLSDTRDNLAAKIEIDCMWNL